MPSKIELSLLNRTYGNLLNGYVMFVWFFFSTALPAVWVVFAKLAGRSRSFYETCLDFECVHNRSDRQSMDIIIFFLYGQTDLRPA